MENVVADMIPASSNETQLSLFPPTYLYPEEFHNAPSDIEPLLVCFVYTEDPRIGGSESRVTLCTEIFLLRD